MPRIDDGGPAFSRPASIDTSSGTLPDGDTVIREQAGMSLRDYFAAHAPAPPEWWLVKYESCWAKSTNLADAAEHYAQWQYVYADAMLAARKQ